MHGNAVRDRETDNEKGRSVLLKLRYCYFPLVFVAYGKLVWSLLLTAEIWFGLFGCGAKSVGSFLLTVQPGPEIGLGLFCLRPTPAISKKDEPLRLF